MTGYELVAKLQALGDADGCPMEVVMEDQEFSMSAPPTGIEDVVLQEVDGKLRVVLTTSVAGWLGQ